MISTLALTYLVWAGSALIIRILWVDELYQVDVAAMHCWSRLHPQGDLKLDSATVPAIRGKGGRRQCSWLNAAQPVSQGLLC
jgi:hypothetical protein